MRLRIVVEPSRVRYSTQWNFDVEEFIAGKWRGTHLYSQEKGHQFFGGTAGGKELAISLARIKAQDYIKARETQDTLWQNIDKPQKYVEEIKIV